MDILFGYENKSTWGLLEEDYGDFSVNIFSDGRIEYKTYIFSGIEKSSESYLLTSKTLQNIKDILELYKKR